MASKFPYFSGLLSYLNSGKVKYGSFSIETKYVQDLLKQGGYLSSNIPSTGYYGKETLNALNRVWSDPAYQEYKKWTQTVYGPGGTVETRTQKAQFEATFDSLFKDAPALKGKTSDQVKAYQDLLKQKGYFPANVDSTGYWGNITEQAYQKALADYQKITNQYNQARSQAVQIQSSPVTTFTQPSPQTTQPSQQQLQAEAEAQRRAAEAEAQRRAAEEEALRRAEEERKRKELEAKIKDLENRGLSLVQKFGGAFKDKAQSIVNSLVNKAKTTGVFEDVENAINSAFVEELKKQAQKIVPQNIRSTIQDKVEKLGEDLVRSGKFVPSPQDVAKQLGGEVAKKVTEANQNVVQPIITNIKVTTQKMEEKKKEVQQEIKQKFEEVGEKMVKTGHFVEAPEEVAKKGVEEVKEKIKNVVSQIPLEALQASAIAAISEKEKEEKPVRVAPIKRPKGISAIINPDLFKEMWRESYVSPEELLRMKKEREENPSLWNKLKKSLGMRAENFVDLIKNHPGKILLGELSDLLNFNNWITIRRKTPEELKISNLPDYHIFEITLSPNIGNTIHKLKVDVVALFTGKLFIYKQLGLNLETGELENSYIPESIRNTEKFQEIVNDQKIKEAQGIIDNLKAGENVSEDDISKAWGGLELVSKQLNNLMEQAKNAGVIFKYEIIDGKEVPVGIADEWLDSNKILELIGPISDPLLKEASEKLARMNDLVKQKATLLQGGVGEVIGFLSNPKEYNLLEFKDLQEQLSKNYGTFQTISSLQKQLTDLSDFLNDNKDFLSQSQDLMAEYQTIVNTMQGLTTPEIEEYTKLVQNINNLNSSQLLQLNTLYTRNKQNIEQLAKLSSRLSEIISFLETNKDKLENINQKYDLYQTLVNQLNNIMTPELASLIQKISDPNIVARLEKANQILPKIEANKDKLDKLAAIESEYQELENWFINNDKEIKKRAVEENNKAYAKIQAYHKSTIEPIFNKLESLTSQVEDWQKTIEQGIYKIRMYQDKELSYQMAKVYAEPLTWKNLFSQFFGKAIPFHLQHHELDPETGEIVAKGYFPNLVNDIKKILSVYSTYYDKVIVRGIVPAYQATASAVSDWLYLTTEKSTAEYLTKNGKVMPNIIFDQLNTLQEKINAVKGVMYTPITREEWDKASFWEKYAKSWEIYAKQPEVKLSNMLLPSQKEEVKNAILRGIKGIAPFEAEPEKIADQFFKVADEWGPIVFDPLNYVAPAWIFDAVKGAYIWIMKKPAIRNIPNLMQKYEAGRLMMEMEQGIAEVIKFIGGGLLNPKYASFYDEYFPDFVKFRDKFFGMRMFKSMPWTLARKEWEVESALRNVSTVSDINIEKALIRYYEEANKLAPGALSFLEGTPKKQFLNALALSKVNLEDIADKIYGKGGRKIFEQQTRGFFVDYTIPADQRWFKVFNAAGIPLVEAQYIAEHAPDLLKGISLIFKRQQMNKNIGLMFKRSFDIEFRNLTPLAQNFYMSLYTCKNEKLRNEIVDYYLNAYAKDKKMLRQLKSAVDLYKKDSLQMQVFRDEAARINLEVSLPSNWQVARDEDFMGKETIKFLSDGKKDSKVFIYNPAEVLGPEEVLHDFLKGVIDAKILDLENIKPLLVEKQIFEKRFLGYEKVFKIKEGGGKIEIRFSETPEWQQFPTESHSFRELLIDSFFKRKPSEYLPKKEFDKLLDLAAKIKPDEVVIKEFNKLSKPEWYSSKAPDVYTEKWYIRQWRPVEEIISETLTLDLMKKTNPYFYEKWKKALLQGVSRENELKIAELYEKHPNLIKNKKAQKDLSDSWYEVKKSYRQALGWNEELPLRPVLTPDEIRKEIARLELQRTILQLQEKGKVVVPDFAKQLLFNKEIPESLSAQLKKDALFYAQAMKDDWLAKRGRYDISGELEHLKELRDKGLISDRVMKERIEELERRPKLAKYDFKFNDWETSLKLVLEDNDLNKFDEINFSTIPFEIREKKGYFPSVKSEKFETEWAKLQDELSKRKVEKLLQDSNDNIIKHSVFLGTFKKRIEPVKLSEAEKEKIQTAAEIYEKLSGGLFKKQYKEIFGKVSPKISAERINFERNMVSFFGDLGIILDVNKFPTYEEFARFWNKLKKPSELEIKLGNLKRQFDRLDDELYRIGDLKKRWYPELEDIEQTIDLEKIYWSEYYKEGKEIPQAELREFGRSQIHYRNAITYVLHPEKVIKQEEKKQLRKLSQQLENLEKQRKILPEKGPQESLKEFNLRVSNYLNEIDSKIAITRSQIEELQNTFKIRRAAYEKDIETLHSKQYLEKLKKDIVGKKKSLKYLQERELKLKQKIDKLRLQIDEINKQLVQESDSIEKLFGVWMDNSKLNLATKLDQKVTLGDLLEELSITDQKVDLSIQTLKDRIELVKKKDWLKLHSDLEEDVRWKYLNKQKTVSYEKIKAEATKELSIIKRNPKKYIETLENNILEQRVQKEKIKSYKNIANILQTARKHGIVFEQKEIWDICKTGVITDTTKAKIKKIEQYFQEDLKKFKNTYLLDVPDKNMLKDVMGYWEDMPEYKKTWLKGVSDEQLVSMFNILDKDNGAFLSYNVVWTNFDEILKKAEKLSAKEAKTLVEEEITKMLERNKVNCIIDLHNVLGSYEFPGRSIHFVPELHSLTLNKNFRNPENPITLTELNGMKNLRKLFWENKGVLIVGNAGEGAIISSRFKDLYFTKKEKQFLEEFHKTVEDVSLLSIKSKPGNPMAFPEWTALAKKKFGPWIEKYELSSRVAREEVFKHEIKLLSQTNLIEELKALIRKSPSVEKEVETLDLNQKGMPVLLLAGNKKYLSPEFINKLKKAKSDGSRFVVSKNPTLGELSALKILFEDDPILRNEPWFKLFIRREIDDKDKKLIRTKLDNTITQSKFVDNFPIFKRIEVPKIEAGAIKKVKTITPQDKQEFRETLDSLIDKLFDNKFNLENLSDIEKDAIWSLFYKHRIRQGKSSSVTLAYIKNLDRDLRNPSILAEEKEKMLRMIISNSKEELIIELSNLLKGADVDLKIPFQILTGKQLDKELEEQLKYIFIDHLNKNNKVDFVDLNSNFLELCKIHSGKKVTTLKEVKSDIPSLFGKKVSIEKIPAEVRVPFLFLTDKGKLDPMRVQFFEWAKGQKKFFRTRKEIFEDVKKGYLEQLLAFQKNPNVYPPDFIRIGVTEGGWSSEYALKRWAAFNSRKEVFALYSKYIDKTVPSELEYIYRDQIKRATGRNYLFPEEEKDMKEWIEKIIFNLKLHQRDVLKIGQTKRSEKIYEKISDAIGAVQQWNGTRTVMGLPIEKNLQKFTIAALKKARRAVIRAPYLAQIPLEKFGWIRDLWIKMVLFWRASWYVWNFLDDEVRALMAGQTLSTTWRITEAHFALTVEYIRELNRVLKGKLEPWDWEAWLAKREKGIMGILENRGKESMRKFLLADLPADKRMKYVKTPTGELLSKEDINFASAAGLMEISTDPVVRSEMLGLMRENTIIDRLNKRLNPFSGVLEVDLELYAGLTEKIRRAGLFHSLLFDRAMTIAQGIQRTKKYLFDYRDLTKAGQIFRKFFPFYTFTAKSLGLYLKECIGMKPGVYIAARNFLDAWEEATQDLPDTYKNRINIPGTGYWVLPHFSILQFLEIVRDPIKMMDEFLYNPQRMFLGLSWDPFIASALEFVTGQKYWDKPQNLLAKGWTPYEIERQLEGDRLQKEDKQDVWSILFNFVPLAPLFKALFDADSYIFARESFVNRKPVREFFKFLGLNVLKYDDFEKAKYIYFDLPPHLRSQWQKDNPYLWNILDEYFAVNKWAKLLKINDAKEAEEELAKLRIDWYVNTYTKLEDQEQGAGVRWLDKHPEIKPLVQQFFDSLNYTPWSLAARRERNEAELSSIINEYLKGLPSNLTAEKKQAMNIMGISVPYPVFSKEKLRNEFFDKAGNLKVSSIKEVNAILTEKYGLQEIKQDTIDNANKRYHDYVVMTNQEKQEQKMADAKYHFELSEAFALMPEDLDELPDEEQQKYWDYFNNFMDAHPETKARYLQELPEASREYNEKIKEYLNMWNSLFKVIENGGDYFKEFYAKPKWFQELYFLKHPEAKILYPFEQKWIELMKLDEENKKKGIRSNLGWEYFWSSENTNVRELYFKTHPGKKEYYNIWGNIIKATEANPESFYPVFFQQPQWFIDQYFKDNPEKKSYYEFMYKWTQLMKKDEENLKKTGQRTHLASDYFWSDANKVEREKYEKANPGILDYLKRWDEITRISEDEPGKFLETFYSQPKEFQERYFSAHPDKALYYPFLKRYGDLQNQGKNAEAATYFWAPENEAARQAYEKNNPGILDYMKFWKKLVYLADQDQWNLYYQYFYAPENKVNRERWFAGDPKREEYMKLNYQYQMMPSVTFEDKVKRQVFLKQNPLLTEYWERNLSADQKAIREKLNQYFDYTLNIPLTGEGKEYLLEVQKWKTAQDHFLVENPEVQIYFNTHPKEITGSNRLIFQKLAEYNSIEHPYLKQIYLQENPDLQEYFNLSQPPGIRKILEIQKQYYSLPINKRQEFLDKNPILLDYWEISNLPYSYFWDKKEFNKINQTFNTIQICFNEFQRGNWVKADKLREKLPEIYKNPGDSENEQWLKFKVYSSAMETWSKVSEKNEFIGIWFFRQLPDWIRDKYYYLHPEKKYLSKEPLGRFLEEPLRIWANLNPDLAWAYKQCYKYQENMPYDIEKKVRKIFIDNGIWEDRTKWTRTQWSNYWTKRAIQANEAREFDFERIPLLRSELNKIGRRFPILPYLPSCFKYPRLSIIKPFF